MRTGMRATRDDAPSGHEVTAVLPLKALARAKARLAPVLDPSGRRDLAAWMFRLVLDACLATPRIGRVLVVAGDAETVDAARAGGAEAILEPRPGLDVALAAADEATAGSPATLVVAADLPLATAGDLERVCAAADQCPCVVVAPTHDGGTGALLRRPGGVIPTAFGPGSAAAHLRLAREAGVPGRRLEVPGLAFDVDRAADLRALRDRTGTSLPARLAPGARR